MALNVKSIMSTTVAWLKANNSTSTGISKNMSKRVQNWYQGVEGMHQDLPISIEGYPVVFLELKTQEEDWAELGNTAKRWIDFQFDIVAVTQTPAGSSSEGFAREYASNECIVLSNNLQEWLRTNIPLSNTVQYFRPVGVDYNATPDEGYYNCVSKIACEAKILST